MSMRQLGELLGVSESAISHYEKGLRQPKQALLLQLADLFEVTVDELLARPPGEAAGEGVLLPVFGRIRAGPPAIAMEEVEGWLAADLGEADGSGRYYYLRVQGDSMRDAGIFDGSRVLIRRQDFAENGDIVACMVDGEEATLKRFRRDGQVVALLPENPSYRPILLSLEDFDSGRAHILGVALMVKTLLK